MKGEIFVASSVECEMSLTLIIKIQEGPDWKRGEKKTICRSKVQKRYSIFKKDTFKNNCSESSSVIYMKCEGRWGDNETVLVIDQ